MLSLSVIWLLYHVSSEEPVIFGRHLCGLILDPGPRLRLHLTHLILFSILKISNLKYL